MTDLVQRLRDHVLSDHVRGCQGRQYSCECGYDAKTEMLIPKAAAEIERLTAEIENLRRWKALDRPLSAAMEIANSHIVQMRAAFAAEARRYASHYPQSSDGRNTFELLAEWVEARGDRASVAGKEILTHQDDTK